MAPKQGVGGLLRTPDLGAIRYRDFREVPGEGQEQETFYTYKNNYYPQPKSGGGTNVRDYSYEALAEVTSTDQNVGRGQLNAALRDIRAQEPELEDSYLLGAEIHERAKMYRAVFPNTALTPNALAKHWQRVKAEVKTNRTDTSPPPSLPGSRREQNLEEARKVLAMLRAER